MNIQLINQNGMSIAKVQSFEPVITDTVSALDFIAAVQYNYGVQSVLLNKEALSEDFFDLSTGMAGEVLQKFVTYQMCLAIVGDFTLYKSRALKEFIFESNKGKHIFFTDTTEKAVEQLIKGENQTIL